MKFVGREEELKVLRDCLGKKSVLIYGRRGVGKTALVRKALEGSRGIYFQAAKLTPSLLYRELAGVVGRAIGDEALSSGQITDPEAIFNHFASKARGQTLVLDQAGYMFEVDPELAIIIQRVAEKNRGKIGLFLTASTSSFPESLLEENSPLMKALDFSMELKPLEFFYTRDFWENLDFRYRAGLYATLGGVPYNWERVIFGRNLFYTIYQTFFRAESPLYREVFNILSEELREPKNYIAILSAISNGEGRFNEIAELSGVPPSSVMKYLDVLREKRLVKRETPVDIEDGKRRGVWKIADPMLNFWFRFVFPRRHYIEFGEGRRAVARLERRIMEYIGEVYKEIAFQIIRRLIGEGKLPSVEKLGKWWGKGAGKKSMEIDIVGLRDKKVVIVGDVKWGRYEREDWKRLLNKVHLLPFEKDRELKFVLFSGEDFMFVVPEGALTITGEEVVQVGQKE